MKLPDRNIPFLADLKELSRCHKKPSVKRESTKSWTANARDVTDVLSELDSEGYNTY